VAHERGWTLLHYHPTADLEWLLREWKPNVAVLPPGYFGQLSPEMRKHKLLSVNSDRTTEGIASVCVDEQKIADVACSHLLSKGLKNLATFRFDNSPFAAAREQQFRETAVSSGGKVAQGWWADNAVPPRDTEDAAGIATWIKSLPKPCGIFACCDSWARVVARYCRVADARIPDEIALIGVDNDTIECELTSPPLSSVAVPWRTLGQETADLVYRELGGMPTAGKRVVVSPLDVVARRSTDVLAVTDPLVVKTVRWICENADRRLTVPHVCGAVGTSRQRLERRFRAVLGRTVMQEIRRAHVEIAKRLLSNTSLDLPKIAQMSGFTNQVLLSVAFRRESGLPPGAYRRRFQGIHLDDD
jgi:LacI family transcriptional regulator